MWNPDSRSAAAADELVDAQVILWHGFCSVHKRFTVEQIDARARRHPGVQVIVHPECPMAVVDAADAYGSTDFIVKAIAGRTGRAPSSPSAPRSTSCSGWRPSTRSTTIFCLDSVICPCSTMYRIHPGYLAWVLESLGDAARCSTASRCRNRSRCLRASPWSGC